MPSKSVNPSPVPATEVTPAYCEQLFKAQAIAHESQALGIESCLPCSGRARQPGGTGWNATQQPWVLDQEAQNQNLRSLLWVDPLLEYFAGHFPDQPILPGVVQLNWCLELAASVWPTGYPEANFTGVQNLKFKTPVQPAALIELVLSQQPGKIAFVFNSPTEVRSQGTLLYRV